MKLATLKKGVHRIYVTVPGEDGAPDEQVWVDYKPGEFTLEVSERLIETVRGGEDDPEQILVLKYMLAPCLHDWDLEDDDGIHMPPTEDNLKRVPLSFLTRILFSMRDDVTPDPPKSGSSNDTSPTTDEQEAPRTGGSLSE
jgi:hypothetical protein